MSTRSIGRGTCPKCGREGAVVVKRLGDREYVYVKHGKVWHYIGPLDNIDLNSIIHEYTTSLPLKTRASGGFMGSGGGSGKSIGKIIALIVGVLMIIVGVLIILLIGFLVPLSLFTLSSVSNSGFTATITVNNTMMALAISPMSPVTYSKVTVTAVNAFFKVANASSVRGYTYINWFNNSLLKEYGPIAWINVTNESIFSGNYTSFATITNQSILIWPYKIVGENALIMVNIVTKARTPSSTIHVSLPALILIAIPFIIAGALIWGGVALYRWSRK